MEIGITELLLFFDKITLGEYFLINMVLGVIGLIFMMVIRVRMG